MSWVADYTHRIAPSALKGAGVVGVCRYLSYPVPSGKVIGRAEYDELRAAGITVILNWEYDASDWLGGAAKGAAHGAEAVRQAKALGHPAGMPLPGSCDIDMSPGQWSTTGRAYALAYASAVRAGNYLPGVYGPWDVLTWCRDQAGYGWFWQAGMSTAWSGGRNANAWPGAHLRQRYHQTVGGLDTDHNDILRPDWAGDDMALSQEDLTNIVNAICNGSTLKGYLPNADAPQAKASQQLSIAAVLKAIGNLSTGAGPSDAQVDAAVAKVMGDPAWIAKFGAAVGADLSRRLGNG